MRFALASSPSCGIRDPPFLGILWCRRCVPRSPTANFPQCPSATQKTRSRSRASGKLSSCCLDARNRSPRVAIFKPLTVRMILRFLASVIRLPAKFLEVQQRCDCFPFDFRCFVLFIRFWRWLDLVGLQTSACLNRFNIDSSYEAHGRKETLRKLMFLNPT